ncbi:MAG: hypothetical protein WDM86_03490 [Rhizomicrobium sp.]
MAELSAADGPTGSDESIPVRAYGAGVYTILLARVPLLVSLVLVFILSDVAIPDSMREALRYSIVDQPYQLVVIAGALLLACLAIRYTGEAMIELVAPELYTGIGNSRLLANLLPRFLPVAVAVATGIPILQLALEQNALATGAQRTIAGIAGLGFAAIGFAVAALPKGPASRPLTTGKPTLLITWSFALFPLMLAIMFAGAILGIWRSGTGTAYDAVERYIAAFVGLLDDGSSPNGLLGRLVHDPSGAPILRYQPYIRAAPFAVSNVSPLQVILELISLYAGCIAARLATAIFLDLTVPRLGTGGRIARDFRRWLPRLASIGLGFALAGQLFYVYLRPSAKLGLSQTEIFSVWAIGALYAAISVLASLGAGSVFAASGAPRESRSVGRRFTGAAARIVALDIRWRWFIGSLFLIGVLIFLLFVDLRNFWIAQYLGPAAVILLWGAAASILFFHLAYLSHMTRLPLLIILLVAAITFAGFDLNDNHELRIVDTAAVSGTVQPDRRPDLDFAGWIASRRDWNAYDHYPVFLIATEGGGIRAAYFTASVLAALQERCPAFAQHTLLISGVSGGSVGSAVFAGLAADHARNLAAPGCNIDGLAKTGAIVARARTTLSADLLSPLLGATLFPDALQRLVPVPIEQFDRSRAIEYAIEGAWAKATTGNCGLCDQSRMAENALNLYGSPASQSAVPYLFLNTTEAGTGRVIPYATVHLPGLATPFRDKAQIDEGAFDNVKPAPSQIERLTLQDRMVDDRIPLSTAAVVSARFPYLTPAGRLSYSGGHYVDGGYFENSGTWLLSGMVQYLIGQQLSYPTGKSAQLDAARNAVFIVIVIQSEPCTRNSIETGCDEDATASDNSWNEMLSPLRALLSTRDERAEYSLDSLGAVSALVEQLTAQGAAPAQAAASANDDIGCDYRVCAVTLRFRNHTRTEIPLSWVLSSNGRQSMDNAVDGMESASVRTKPPTTSISTQDDDQDVDRVLGSYRRVLCTLAARKNATGCAPASGH